MALVPCRVWRPITSRCVAQDGISLLRSIYQETAAAFFLSDGTAGWTCSCTSTLQGAEPRESPTKSNEKSNWANNNFLGFFNFSGVADTFSLHATGSGNNWDKSAAVASVSAAKATSHDVLGSKLLTQSSSKMSVLT